MSQASWETELGFFLGCLVETPEKRRTFWENYFTYLRLFYIITIIFLISDDS